MTTSPISLTIDTKKIKAVLLACAKKDIRYYLNGTFVNSKHIVCTDGHRMHVLAHGQDIGEIEGFIIPRETIELAIKMKTPNFTITSDSVNNIPFDALDGRYPDYKRVIPVVSQGVDNGAIETLINPEYLLDACKAIMLVTGSKSYSALSSVGNVYVWSSAEFCTVVMPTKKGFKDWSATSLEQLA